ncbi:MAG: hypothetical protein UZ17_ACD001002779 [Acidobacteria bacterium OLB17]|nr:MAG: hypothetical protein UZ17_ACD001002779 [Acidobacteria bacterium OLB17]MCZ2390413.1 hypothetical protein [Acidobacteriota bacterium]
MSRIRISILAFIVILMSSLGAAAQNGGKAEPNRITVSTAGTTVRGRLSNGSEMEYVFAAKAGTVLTITNPTPSAFDFRVFSEEAEVETEFESSRTLTLTLPEDGDYLFFVRKKAGGARSASFRITLKFAD